MAASRRRAAPTRRSPSNSGSRGAQRRREQQRRGRLLLACSIVVSALMVVAWFPASSLLSQRQHLSAASAQLASLKAQDRALGRQQATLTSPADVSRLAREQYQLVEPGQRLFQVLPRAGTPTPAGTGQAPYPGDPGLTKPVAPSAVALLGSAAGTPTSKTTQGAGSTHRSTNPAHQGLAQRILGTLAFWRR